MSESLPERQRATLEALEAYWREHGVAPSLGDLARVLGVSRPTAHGHVRALQRKGYIDARDGVSRSWRPRDQAVQVPILGRVAAGAPILAAEHIEGWISVDDRREADVLFALRVRGDSMVDGGILDGDLVVVRQQDTASDGDIVVALLDDEDATVKKLRRVGGEVHLVAMNPNYEPIIIEADRARVLGKVIGVRRRLGEPDAR
jgi:repressor LexA